MRSNRDRNGATIGRARILSNRMGRKPALLAWGCALAILGLLAGPAARATAIPAWLDEAITEWNAEHPETQIEFVDVKDSFVWYRIADTEEISHPQIRESIYGLVLDHGYRFTDDEELVTTGKPPSAVAAYKAKKCWRRSFVRDIEALSNTTSPGGRSSGQRQRMLTSLVCEDVDYWFAGFRILQ